MLQKEKYSVVIPVFNEEAVISTTYQRLKSVMDGLDREYELIFVNDGSQDDSQTQLEQLSLQDPAVKLINFSRNFGH